MYSDFIAFEEIIEGVKIDTGIENLRNAYPKIRTMIYDVERDLKFGGTALLKKITYSLENGYLIKSGKHTKARIPDEALFLESIGMCHEGLCPGDYKIQGKWLFLCKEGIEKFTLLYYTLLVDGEGNPVVSSNHKDAVISGISWRFKKQQFWKKQLSQSDLRYYEEYHFDRLAEAKGNDLMPSTQAEYSKIATIMSYSSKDAILYLSDKKCYCCIEDADMSGIDFGKGPGDINTGNPGTGGTGGGSTGGSNETETSIYSFQFDDYRLDINDNGLITDQWLTDNAKAETEASLLEGKEIAFPSIGRIGFAIKTDTAGQYQIVDIMNNDITESVFDTIFDPVRGTEIYISKEFYTPQNLYLRFKKN